MRVPQEGNTSTYMFIMHLAVFYYKVITLPIITQEIKIFCSKLYKPI